MEDRIGQRLLRLFGLNLDLKNAAAPLAPQAAEPPPPPKEDTVARFEANPFAAPDAWSARDLPEQPVQAPPPQAEERDARELAEQAAPAQAREEVTEKAPAHVEEAEVQEKRDVDESKESDRGDDEQQEKDEHGGGWVMEEAAQEESEASKGLRNLEVLGEETRCHGLIEDGTRCLRKPIDGKAYCAEHSVGTFETAPDTTPDAEAYQPEQKEAEPEPELRINAGSKIIS
jgi:hypothetical protein